LSAKQERQLAQKVIEENDPLARERLVKSNLRLVVNIAKRYVGRGISLGDLIEEGNIGLIKAVDYFDPAFGTRFSTYAAWWIKQSIKQALLSASQPVHVPTYMVALINQFRHTAAELETKIGRSPTIKEMAEIMKLPVHKAAVVEQIVSILSTVRDTGSTDSDDRETLRDTLQDTNAPMPEDALLALEERQKVLRLLNEIDPRDAEVLKLHYGLDGKKPMTLKQIGQKMNLTRERIRQIQKKALTTLYEYMN
jgi:RNA polymerase primary sigma factor